MPPRRVWVFRRHVRGATAPQWDALAADGLLQVEGEDPAAAVAEALRGAGEAGEFEIVAASGALLAAVIIQHSEVSRD